MNFQLLMIESLVTFAQILEALTTLWEASARATHTFLTEEDIISLRPVIAEALMEIPHLIFYVKILTHLLKHAVRKLTVVYSFSG